jgi:hypothetical protein
MDLGITNFAYRQSNLKLWKFNLSFQT